VLKVCIVPSLPLVWCKYVTFPDDGFCFHNGGATVTQTKTSEQKRTCIPSIIFGFQLSVRLKLLFALSRKGVVSPA
jgi:hypothetical protein